MKKKILLVEQNNDGTIGGSHYCMLYLVRGLNREKYEPIAVFYERNSLLSRFEEICPVFVIDPVKFTGGPVKLLKKTASLFLTVKFILKCFFYQKEQHRSCTSE